jgi:hypothetical protein
VIGMWLAGGRKTFYLGPSWIADSSLAGMNLGRCGSISEKSKSLCSRPSLWHAPMVLNWYYWSHSVSFRVFDPSRIYLEVLEMTSTLSHR